MFSEAITAELKRALKEQDALRLSVFRMLSAAIHVKEIEKRTRQGQAKPAALSEEEIMQVIRSELKKRKDAAEAYRRGGRFESADQEQAEADVLATLLPQEIGATELESVVDEGIASLGVNSEKEFGKLMGWVMQRLGGRVSGERVAESIRKKLAAI